MIYIYIFFGIVIAFSVLEVVLKELAERRIEQQPVRSVPAQVVTKYPSAGSRGEEVYVPNSGYVVFKLKDGENQAWEVTTLYSMLAEGDEGILTYQGERFLNFQRQ